MQLAERFVEALLRFEILQLGEFTTKSGRISPYFFNTGRLASSESLGLVAELYATAIAAHWGRQIDYLFGPAYKGIPLAVMVADRLACQRGKPVFFSFNRKEAKAHGEAGRLVGFSYGGGEEVLIVEDVLTGGTSVRETMAFLAPYQVKILGVFVGIDREERGLGELAARDEIERDFGIPVVSLVRLGTMIDLLAAKSFLGRHWLPPASQARVEAYRRAYGPKPSGSSG